MKKLIILLPLTLVASQAHGMHFAKATAAFLGAALTGGYAYNKIDRAHAAPLQPCPDPETGEPNFEKDVPASDEKKQEKPTFVEPPLDNSLPLKERLALRRNIQKIMDIYVQNCRPDGTIIDDEDVVFTSQRRRMFEPTQCERLRNHLAKNTLWKIYKPTFNKGWFSNSCQSVRPKTLKELNDEYYQSCTNKKSTHNNAIDSYKDLKSHAVTEQEQKEIQTRINDLEQKRHDCARKKAEEKFNDPKLTVVIKEIDEAMQIAKEIKRPWYMP